MERDFIEQSPQKRPISWEAITITLLLMILAMAAYFRFTGLNWDQNFHLHPDERYLTIVGSSLEGASDPITYLQTSKSPLNPYNANQTFYVYGNFPMTMTRYGAEWANQLCTTFTGTDGVPPGWCTHNFTAYDGIQIFGRFLSGLVDILSIIFLFLMGRRLFNDWIGLMAALLLAMAVMPIQQSHFFTMDNWAAALTTFTMYTAVRIAGFGERHVVWQKRWWILFGVGLGLAVASRINIAPLALMVNVAGLLWLLRRGHSWASIRKDIGDLFAQRPELYENGRSPSEDIQRVIYGIALAAFISFLTFRVAQPYAFADPALIRQTAVNETGQEPNPISVAVQTLVGFNPQWRANMDEIQNMQGPEFAAPFALQWTDRTPILFPFTNMVLYGMGITAGLMAWIGTLWGLARIVRGKPDWMALALPVSWSLLYFFFMGTRWVLSTRYFLPIYPTLLLMGAWGMWQLLTMARRSERLRPLKGIAAALLVVAVVLPTYFWAAAFTQTYTRPVTRIEAARWVLENVPSGATLLYEVDGVEKEWQLPLRTFEFATGGNPLVLRDGMPEDGMVTAVRLNYVRQQSPSPVTFELQYGDGTQMHQVTVETTLSDERQPLLFDLPDSSVTAQTPQDLMITLTSGDPVFADTSHIFTEHWDDGLPAGIDGRNIYGSYYLSTRGEPLPVTHLDNQQKRQDLISWLDESDYILLYSQRAVWSLPRIPVSFPMMTTFYQNLFAEELGFELAADFHADYHVGPLYFSDTTGQISWGEPPQVGWPPPGDLAAEEAFSVYDHPPVWIFAKSENYDRDKVVNILGAVDLDPSKVVFMNPGEATNAKGGLLLTAEEQTLYRQNGTFRDIFNLDSPLATNPTLAAVVWWVAVVLLGWLAFPVTAVILRGLPDRGYAFSRILALLLISYFGWLMANFKWLPNNRNTYLLGLGILTVGSILLFLRRRAAIVTFVRQHLAYIGTVELFSLLLYLLFIGVRLRNPDLWDLFWGGEKPMDMTYFTAVLKSVHFPPYDPWYAGGYLNYYYFGFVYVGALTQLLGTVPAIAYNLSVILIFSFTGLSAFGVAYNLAAYRASQQSAVSGQQSAVSGQPLNRGAVVAGLLAGGMAVLIGNLSQIGVMLGAWHRTGTDVLNTGIGGVDGLARTLDGAIRILSGQTANIPVQDWFWTATRAINVEQGEVGPITEFPFFTFLYGDLHAHMISLPLTMLAVAWGVALVMRADQSRPMTWWETAVSWGVGAVAIGVLQAANIWDLPTYLVIGVLSVSYAVFLRNGRQLNIQTIGQVSVQSVLLVGLALLAFYPFSANFGAGFSSVGVWDGSHTYLANYLSIHGLFLFFIVGYLFIEFRAWAQTLTAQDLQEWRSVGFLVLAVLGLYLLILLLFFIQGYWIVPLALTITVVAGLLSLRAGLPPHRRMVLALIASAVALTIFVEFFIVEGTVQRMNTVFKVYMQVWMMLSVVGGVTAVWVWQKVRQTETVKQVWQVTTVVLAMGVLLYPIQATTAKWRIRMNQDAPNTLDGMAFMPYVSYDEPNGRVSLDYDYDALRWMQRNVEGSPVIAEMVSRNYYRSMGNRVAMFTGLPSIIGWAGHQDQQRAAVPNRNVGGRINDVELLFNTTQPNEALRIIDKYDVGYIYVGQLEWVTYSPDGLNKFDQMVDQGHLEEVYRNAGTSIYRVINQEER